jgi:Uma2 family endonuclease
MRPITTSAAPGPIDYPESDGQPMSDNTKQFEWIVTLFGNLAGLFAADPDVFVCGNQAWYPVEGHPEISAAPDVYVVFGRPKGHRPSYKQWEEDNVPMTVTFEILSPRNTQQEMADKQAFYDEYGVEEYYLYDPDTNRLSVFIRRGQALVRERKTHGFVSPRLGIRFDLGGPEMVVYYPDGTPFRSFQEVAGEVKQARQEVERERQRADEATLREEQERQRAEQERQRAEQERQRAEAATRREEQARQREEQERQRADDAARREEQQRQQAGADRLRAERLAALVGRLRRGEATPEDLDELDRLTRLDSPE